MKFSNICIKAWILLLIIIIGNQADQELLTVEENLSYIRDDVVDIEEIMYIPQPEQMHEYTPQYTNIHALQATQQAQQNKTCSVTQAGCKCAKNWSVPDQPEIFYDGCANPDKDPMGDWCHIDINTCITVPVGGTNSNTPFDYCTPDCSQNIDIVDYNNSTTNSYELDIINAIYYPYPQSISQGVGVGVELGVGVEGEFLEFCNDTRSGCKCRLNWNFEEQIYNGCSNPDNDPLGLWCVVDLESCDSTPKGASFVEAPYDYCLSDCPVSLLNVALINYINSPPPQNIQIYDIENFMDFLFSPVDEFQLDIEILPIDDDQIDDDNIDCSISRAGCKCLKSWEFTFQTFSGCANPDLDSDGPWCMIELGTCTEGDPFGGNLNPPIDYCHKKCEKNNHFSQPPILASRSFQTDCEKTVQGCTCLENWEYQGQIFNNCANPDNDPLGLWCAVQAGCTGQISQLIINGIITDTYFDYCQADCVQQLQQQQIQQNEIQNGCDKTQNGCLCQPIWEFGGQTFSGCANPDDHDKGDWCEVLEETCNVDVTSLDPIFSQNMVVAYADNCKAECIESDTFDNTYDEPQLEIQDYQQSNSSHQNLSVKEGVIQQPGPLSETQIQQKICSNQTISGCTCRQYWTFEGQQYSACQNPDNDQIGNWCMIHEDKTSCPSANEIKDSDGRIIDYYDYCLDTCQPQTQPPPPNPTSTPTLAPGGDSIPTPTPTPASGGAPNPTPILASGGTPTPTLVPEGNSTPTPTPFTPCATTQSGCKCKNEWMYDGDLDGINMAYFGCINTINDNILPWCQIEDINACIREPRSAIIGDEKGWDYCDPQCSPPKEGGCTNTVNGCECRPVWSYDGIEQIGCTRPDADRQFSWCVVDVDSCDQLRTSGQIPGTNEYWDICESSC